jgi:hypothetical protein
MRRKRAWPVIVGEFTSRDLLPEDFDEIEHAAGLALSKAARARINTAIFTAGASSATVANHAAPTYDKVGAKIRNIETLSLRLADALDRLKSAFDPASRAAWTALETEAEGDANGLAEYLDWLIPGEAKRKPVPLIDLPEFASTCRVLAERARSAIPLRDTKAGRPIAHVPLREIVATLGCEYEATGRKLPRRNSHKGPFFRLVKATAQAFHKRGGPKAPRDLALGDLIRAYLATRAGPA